MSASDNYRRSPDTCMVRISADGKECYEEFDKRKMQMHDDLLEMLNKSALEQIKGSIFGIEGNILCHKDLKRKENSVAKASYHSGFIDGLSMAKGMLEAILRLQDAKDEYLK